MIRLLTTTACAVLALSGPALANKVFVSNEKGNTISVIDTADWSVLTEFHGGNRPRGITISPNGKLLYVCASDDDLVRVFDTETYEELYTLPSGPDPELFVLHPSGNPLFIANEDDNIVTVVDTQTHQVLVHQPVRDDIDAKIGAVVRDRRAVAIDQPPAPRRHQRQVDAVAFGQLRIFPVLRHRDPAHAPRQH